MDKYWEEDMRSYSNCSNAGKINIDLPNLFCSELCLSPSNDQINNLKDYGDFAEENKQYDSSNITLSRFCDAPGGAVVGCELESEMTSLRGFLTSSQIPVHIQLLHPQVHHRISKGL